MNANLEDSMESIPEAVMRELLKECRTCGKHWRSILEDKRYPLLNRKVGWFTNERKGMFYKLVKPAKRKAFLDVGAGSGIVSVCLSEEYEKGYALESQESFAEFMEHRFLMDSIGNVDVLHWSALQIPLPDNSIDLAVLNGVLEWIPHADKTANPRQVQLRFLREVSRCLAPGGKIAIAIENAWHHLQIKGFSAHGTARFVALLPKPIGNIVNRLVKKRPYLEYIYSTFGYRKLLKEGGYGNCNIYVVVPDYYSPVDIYSFEKNALNEFFRKYHEGSRSKSMIKRLSDIVGVPYPLAFFEAAFYIETEKSL